MKKYLFFLLVFSLTGCTKVGLIKTGLSNGKFPGTMLEYLESDSYNWDSTLLMIHTAELEEVFKGEKLITFFGPTNHSIRRYMLENDIKRVEDMGKDFCRKILLRHIYEGKVMRDDVPRGTARTGSELRGSGGQDYTMMGGNIIWLYTFRDPYNDVPDTGPVSLYLVSIDGKIDISIASTNIEPTNGVVHSLGYDFTLGEM